MTVTNLQTVQTPLVHSSVVVIQDLRGMASFAEVKKSPKFAETIVPFFLRFHL